MSNELEAGWKEYVLAGREARPPAARSAAAAGPLPRQIGTNSNGNGKPVSEVLTPYRAKRRFAVQKDVEGFVRQWGGEDFCAELTLTFHDNVTDKSEAGRRFNSLRTAFAKLGIRSFLGCWERQARGAWHLHLLIALPRPVRNQDGSRAYLQSLRDFLCGTREEEHRDGLLVKRGFGYIHHLAPIRKTAARFAGYFTSYLTKTWIRLQGEAKRVRLVTYARNVLRCASVHFSWNGPKGREWRFKKQIYAKRRGCDTFDEAKAKLGADWEYRYRRRISEMVLAVA